MTRNAKWTAGAVIVIVVAAAILFAVFHNPSTPSTNNVTGSTGQNNKPASNENSIILTKTDSKLGNYLTDGNGRALYTYNADRANTSNCTGSCLASWPAYTATSSVANLPAGISTFKRTDNGQLQYAYNGMPLYYFASDSSGQVTGNGVENFQVAKPASATPQSSSSADQSASGSSGYPY